MMISLTVRNLVNLGLWSRVCEYKGWDPHILGDGLISLDSIVEFDDEFLKKDIVPIEQLKMFLFNISSDEAMYCGIMLARSLEDAKLKIGTIHEVSKITTIQEITKEQLYNMKNKHLVICRKPL